MKKNINYDKYIVENLRQKYVENDNMTLFKKLYSKNLSEIPNMNTGYKWDELNKTTKQCLESSPIYKDKLSIVYKLLDQKRGDLLNVGFGNGILEKKLSRLKLNLFGLDFSERSVADINRTVKGVFKKGTVLNIPFKSKSFDFILLLDILEHISAKNTFQALKEVDRVLKKDGTVIISVPLNENLRELIQTGCNTNMHVREYTPEILEAEFRLFSLLKKKEYFLYAFKKFYVIKNIIIKILFKGYRIPNLYILVVKKK